MYSVHLPNISMLRRCRSNVDSATNSLPLREDAQVSYFPTPSFFADEETSDSSGSPPAYIHVPARVPSEGEGGMQLMSKMLARGLRLRCICSLSFGTSRHEDMSCISEHTIIDSHG